VSCNNYNYLWLQSGNTTCWANAGTKSVVLYGVYGVNSGNNAGYISGSGYTLYFSKWASSPVPSQTIYTVHIN
jgi:hypothetical protein